MPTVNKEAGRENDIVWEARIGLCDLGYSRWAPRVDGHLEGYSSGQTRHEAAQGGNTGRSLGVGELLIVSKYERQIGLQCSPVSRTTWQATLNSFMGTLVSPPTGNSRISQFSYRMVRVE